jgi:hypothetical protein
MPSKPVPEFTMRPPPLYGSPSGPDAGESLAGESPAGASITRLMGRSKAVAKA